MPERNVFIGEQRVHNAHVDRPSVAFGLDALVAVHEGAFSGKSVGGGALDFLLRAVELQSLAALVAGNMGAPAFEFNH